MARCSFNHPFLKLINHQGRAAFYLALGLVPILVRLRNEGIPLSNESYYAHAAVKWLRTGAPTLGANYFEHRWALIYPTSLIAQWFGTTSITLTAWSTICYIGVVALTYTWLKKYQPQAAFWSAAILATNPAMIWCAVNISPDVVCTFFMLGAMLLTFTRETGNPWLKGAAVATALTFAFLAKETAVFFGIPLVVFAVGDTIKHRKSSFWIALACTGLVLLGAYLSAYYTYIGN
jgi:4-amino-4-deoxy-L-arabinose transferase-like glycosyltransferase